MRWFGFSTIEIMMDFPGGPVKTALPLQRAWVQSLVRGTKILYAVYPETRLPKIFLINKITKAKNRKSFKKDIIP